LVLSPDFVRPGAASLEHLQVLDQRPLVGVRKFAAELVPAVVDEFRVLAGGEQCRFFFTF
jgi:hypothetical protein